MKIKIIRIRLIMYRCLYCLPLLCSIQSLHATNYYLSATGNDNNAGTTMLQPWKTIERLNKQPLKGGDAVLFKRGDSFYGELTCKYSGSKNMPVMYGAYGKGAMPVITGAVEIKNLQPVKNNIYAATCNQNILAVFIDNQQQLLARYPNAGFSIMQNGVGNTVSFIDSNLTQPDDYWKGVNIRFRTWDWEIRTSTVNSFANHTITIKDSSTNTLSKGWGYYFDNKFELLDTTGEWFYNKDKQQFFLYSNDKPAANIEAVCLSSGITILKNVHYVTINQLNIEKFFDNGIVLAGNNQYIHIYNNKINQIQKTGVSINEIALNCSISNNKIIDINGRGIFALEAENLLIEKNLVTHIGNIMGYGISGVNNMIGIVVANNEVIKDSTAHIGLNNIIRGNTIHNTGYVGIRMDGAHSIIEKNSISNVMNKLSDGSAIYCWAKSKFYTHDNIIRNNIVFDVVGSNYGTASGPNPAANGIYVDNNCYNIAIAYNTVFNISASGIHINSDAYNNLVIKNIVYNCVGAFSVAEWATEYATFGNICTNNTFFIITPKQRAVTLINFLLPGTNGMVAMDSNRYYHFWSDTLITDIYNTKDSAGITIRHTNEYNFADWKKHYGYEMYGLSFTKSPTPLKISGSKILYNASDKIKNVTSVKQHYYNLEGKLVYNLRILPYSSVIVLTGETLK